MGVGRDSTGCSRRLRVGSRFGGRVGTTSWLLPALLIVASCLPPQHPSPPPSDDAVAAAAQGTGVHTNPVVEAPMGFDNLTNGFCANQAAMDAAREAFSEVESFEDGIGPVFNSISCVSCHETPLSQAGTGSQITELRAGHFDGKSFVDHPGGSLIND